MAYSRLLLALLFILLAGVSVNADDGHPIAIRKWSDQGFTIETMWNLHVSVGVDESTKKKLPREVDASLEKLPGLAGQAIYLNRAPNQKAIAISEKSSAKKSNQVTLVRSKNFEKEPHRDARPLSETTSVSVDAVNIEFLDHDGISMESRVERLSKLKSPEKTSAFVAVAVGDSFTAEFCEKYAEKARPAIMIVNSKLKSIAGKDVQSIDHNTLAVSAKIRGGEKTRFISLSDKPYKMSNELAELFDKKEKSAKKSRETFAKLSVDQLNFKPANGTHTPRWNTCLLYTSPSPRDQRGSRMPSSA